MARKFLLLALTASAVLSLANQASAQKVPPGQPVPNLDGLPEELQRRIQQMIGEAQRQKGRPAEFGPVLAWGDARLTPVDAKLQEKLGLPENEGMVVTVVAPNSAAQRAGLKVDDVLVKINNKAVPTGIEEFVKLVKDQKQDEAIDLVVVRNGKEETLKGARMPAVAQTGGGGRRPAVPNFPFPAFPNNPGRLPNNPFFPAGIEYMRLEMTVNGAKFVREIKVDQFSNEYSKGELKITLSGKMENGLPRPTEITVQEGKDLKKYTSPKEVPAQHRPILQQLMPSPLMNMLLMPQMLPNFRDFPGLPVIPGIDN